MIIHKLAGVFLAVSSLAACGGSGMGKAVRADINTQMQSAEPTLSKCYADALERDRDLAGRIELSFRAVAKTGKFEDVSVAKDTVGDDGLSQCVVATVMGLTLAKPQSTAVKSKYPLDFNPQ